MSEEKQLKPFVSPTRRAWHWLNRSWFYLLAALAVALFFILGVAAIESLSETPAKFPEGWNGIRVGGHANWVEYATLIVAVIALPFAIWAYISRTELERTQWAFTLFKTLFAEGDQSGQAKYQRIINLISYEGTDSTKICEVTGAILDWECEGSLVRAQTELSNYLNFFECVAILCREEQIDLDIALLFYDAYLEEIDRHERLRHFIHRYGYENLEGLLRERRKWKGFADPPPPDPDPKFIFLYGTLRGDLQEQHQSLPRTVRDFLRPVWKKEVARGTTQGMLIWVKDEESPGTRYPGLKQTKSAEEQVHGIVYDCAEDPYVIELLDKYEGEAYERKTAAVKILSHKEQERTKQAPKDANRTELDCAVYVALHDGESMRVDDYAKLFKK
jgi:hypothetical protein